MTQTQNEILKAIFGEKPKPKPKSVKLTKEQYLQHKAKHGISETQKAQIIEAQEIRKYGREARLKKARKADIKSVLVEKGTRPKGRYYDLTPLEQICGIDVVTPEAQDEARILHFGGSIKD